MVSLDCEEGEGRRYGLAKVREGMVREVSGGSAIISR
jgi:hypothetical protein